MDTLGSRIKYVRGKESQESFANSIGVSKGSLGGYERDENSPSADAVLKICSKANISAEWLLQGSGPMTRGEAPVNGKAYPVHTEAGVDIIEAEKTSIVLIPMVEAVLSAGNGSLETAASSERKYSFREDFLRRKGDHKQMVLMRVAGDSMEPEIKDGDVVLIDQSQKRLRPNDIFAVAFEEMIYVKRVNAMPGKIILSSDNSELYPPFEVDTAGDLEESLRIIGRVIWLCREK